MAERNVVDKDLVAEQPGLGLSFIGLFLAFFVGLSIRAAVAPERVQAHLQQATQNIHKDLDFRFQKAYVSFARGLWPDLSVVIEGLQIESKNACLFNPLAEVNEVRLPLSMKHLLRGQILIHEVLADEVNLSLRAAYQECPQEVQLAPAVESAKPEASVKKQKPVIARFENVPRENPIDTVSISKLKIHYLPVAFTSFYIEDFQAQLKSNEPRWIQILGRLNLEGDSLVRDYGSFADLQFDILEGEQASLAAAIKGVWREGQYDVQMKLDSKTQNVVFESDFRQLPLSRVLPILKKYRWVESEFNGKRGWVSGKMKLQGPLSQIKKTPLQLSQLKLEGDLGEVTCSQFEIQSLDPFQFRPVDFQLRGLNVKELLVFLNRPHPSPALGDLGIFNGTAHFVSPEQLSLRGDYSGLEFIFSNRGTRQIQTLSLVSGELELKKNQWQIQVDRIKPVEGLFEGKVKMQADKDFKDLKVEASITELGLSPRIQTLMTGGGSLGALSGQLKARLVAAQITDLNGQLKWDQLLVEGVKILKPKALIQTKNQEFDIHLSAQELEIFPDSIASSFFMPLFEESSGKSLILKNPSALIQTKKFLSLSWNQFQAHSPQGLLKSQGHWNERADLSGKIQILGAKPKSWDIQGTRSQPRFVLRDL